MSSADKAYLQLVQHVLDTGTRRAGRNGETVSLFAQRLEFLDITAEFPLLTTKRVYWKGVIEELLWFLEGCTDVSKLRARGVHIWDGNSTRDYLDTHGLSNYTEHEEAGPIYGWQWRHFGAKYIDCHTDYSGQGVDQIVDIINGIKKDPTSRRHILSAWNPADLVAMILPPCHAYYQFYADPVTKTLDCQMYMRSCDIFLGLPFNIASTATLMKLVATATGYTARRLVIVFGDAHIYSDHMDAVREQLTREPRPAPKMRIARVTEDLHGLTAADFVLEEYNPHGTIKAPMAA